MGTNPFWDFSLQHYARRAVQHQCLQLQEKAGANVNVLLFALWLASRRRLFDQQRVLDHAELMYWHEQVIVPLRQARCGVKQSQHADGLYEQIKQAELDSERVEQDILYGLRDSFAEASAELTLTQLAVWNVKGYLQMLPLGDELVDQNTEKLVGEVFAEVDR